MICRSLGKLMILLASITRRTSPVVTSRSSPETATTARLFVLRIWSPVMPTKTSSKCVPAMRSARSVAASMDLIVSSKSTTTPLRIPRDGASPNPTISRPAEPLTATTVQVLVVPISSPHTVSCLIPAPSSLANKQRAAYYDILWFNRTIPTTPSGVVARLAKLGERPSNSLGKTGQRCGEAVHGIGAQIITVALVFLLGVCIGEENVLAARPLGHRLRAACCGRRDRCRKFDCKRHLYRQSDEGRRFKTRRRRPR